MSARSVDKASMVCSKAELFLKKAFTTKDMPSDITLFILDVNYDLEDWK